MDKMLLSILPDVLTILPARRLATRTNNNKNIEVCFVCVCACTIGSKRMYVSVVVLVSSSRSL